MSPLNAQPADPYQLVQARYGTMLANRNDRYIGHALIEYGEYCEIETQFLQQWISRPGTVVEVGANIGSQTVALARAARAVGGDVVAFEPQPFVFQNLCANLALNALDNVSAWPFACAAQAGTVWLPSPDYRQPGNFGAVSVQAPTSAQGIQMPCVRLDDMFRSRAITLIKVDVEGFELQVLQGAQETIASQQPILYLENDRIAQSASLIEYVWGLDYRLWWHVTPLFNPANFRLKAENLFPGLFSINMIGVPRALNIEIEGCDEIVDTAFHPAAKNPA